MQIIEMERDGNCLFQCIAHALEIENGPETLRNFLANTLEDFSIDLFLNYVLNMTDDDPSICDPVMVARFKSVDKSLQKQIYRDCLRDEKMFADELCIRKIADHYNVVNCRIIS